jgi:hypothetical protein
VDLRRNPIGFRNFEPQGDPWLRNKEALAAVDLWKRMSSFGYF